MKDFLDINLRCLNNQSIAEVLNRVSPMENIKILLSKSGYPVPCFCDKGHDQAYHSLFDPLKEGIKLYHSHKPGGMKIFLGLGGAYQINPFLNESRILIIESSPAHMKALLSLIDYSPLLSSARVTLLCSPKGGIITQWLKDNYLPLIDGGLDMIPLRPQIRFDQSVFDLYAREVETALGQMATDCSTQKKMGRLWQRNIISNVNRALSSPMSLPLIKNSTEALLIAAGPSLSMYRDYIENLPDHVLLMAVDTALPVLNAWDICPDYVLILDPQFIGYLHFMNPLPEGCTVLADLGCSLPHELTKVNWFSTVHPLSEYLSRNSSPLITLRGGAGNVTQAGLEILIRSGFSKITLLGADFSYPRAKPYERESYFYPWFSVRSQRTSPMENHLTQFVLKQQNLKKEGFLYKTERLETYKKEMTDFVRSCQAHIKQVSQGKWVIKVPAPKKSIEQPKPLETEILPFYKERLTALKSFNTQAEWATLIPLAYSFYEENEPDASEKSLNKAREYTINLINHHI